MPTVLQRKSVKHPDTFSDTTGRTSLIEGIESINQSIRLILTTSKGELWGDPDYGCNLQRLLFDYEGETLTRAIQLDITNALNKYEPRIFVQESDISLTYSGVNAYITISYSIRYTDYRQSYQYLIPYKEDTRGTV